MLIRDRARIALAVARVTFSELVRDRILYNVLVVTGLLFMISILASKLTFMRPERIIVDFGIAAVTISSGLIAVFSGASILIREFERRTIAVALARPISRGDFVLGKYLGLCGVLACNWALASAALLVLLSLQGEDGRMMMGATLAAGLGLCLIQSLVLAAIALFFSTFSTTSISTMLTLGLYFVGVNSTGIRALAQKTDSRFAQLMLDAVVVLVPDFESFSLGSRVTYALPVASAEVGMAISYAFLWLVALLIASGYLVRMRDG